MPVTRSALTPQLRFGASTTNQGDEMTETVGGTSQSGIDEPVVALLSEQFEAVRALADEVPDEDWATSTDLPGWTVQDCFSHMIGVERGMLGLSEEAPPVDHLAHLGNDFARMVEAPVELRRTRTPAEVRAELHDILAQRRSALEASGTEAFDEESWTPTGPGTYRDFMFIRLFDLWMHEQDVRHALDRPGHLSGPVVASVLANNAAKALPLIVGKRADAPIGSVVAIDVVGPTEASFAVQVNDVSGKKRAALIEPGDADDPTATLAIDVDTFMRLCGGRADAASALEANPEGITLGGDTQLARAVVDNLAFTP